MKILKVISSTFLSILLMGTPLQVCAMKRFFVSLTKEAGERVGTHFLKQAGKPKKHVRLRLTNTNPNNPSFQPRPDAPNVLKLQLSNLKQPAPNSNPVAGGNNIKLLRLPGNGNTTQLRRGDSILKCFNSGEQAPKQAKLPKQPPKTEVREPKVEKFVENKERGDVFETSKTPIKPKGKPKFEKIKERKRAAREKRERVEREEREREEKQEREKRERERVEREKEEKERKEREQLKEKQEKEKEALEKKIQERKEKELEKKKNENAKETEEQETRKTERRKKDYKNGHQLLKERLEFLKEEFKNDPKKLAIESEKAIRQFIKGQLKKQGMRSEQEEHARPRRAGTVKGRMKRRSEELDTQGQKKHDKLDVKHEKERKQLDKQIENDFVDVKPVKTPQTPVKPVQAPKVKKSPVRVRPKNKIAKQPSNMLVPKGDANGITNVGAPGKSAGENLVLLLFGRKGTKLFGKIVQTGAKEFLQGFSKKVKAGQIQDGAGTNNSIIKGVFGKLGKGDKEVSTFTVRQGNKEIKGLVFENPEQLKGLLRRYNIKWSGKGNPKFVMELGENTGNNGGRFVGGGTRKLALPAPRECVQGNRGNQLALPQVRQPQVPQRPPVQQPHAQPQQGPVQPQQAPVQQAPVQPQQIRPPVIPQQGPRTQNNTRPPQQQQPRTPTQPQQRPRAENNGPRTLVVKPGTVRMPAPRGRGNGNIVPVRPREKRLVVQPPREKRLVVQPPREKRLVVQPPREKRLVVQPPREKRLVVQPPREKRLVVQPPREKRLVVQPPREKRLVVRPPREKRLVVRPPRETRLVVRPPRNNGRRNGGIRERARLREIVRGAAALSPIPQQIQTPATPLTPPQEQQTPEVQPTPEVQQRPVQSQRRVVHRPTPSLRLPKEDPRIALYRKILRVANTLTVEIMHDTIRMDLRWAYGESGIIRMLWAFNKCCAVLLRHQDAQLTDEDPSLRCSSNTLSKCFGDFEQIKKTIREEIIRAAAELGVQLR